MDEVDVAVVGGGVAGLVASIRLAKMGYRVGLLEATTVLGGRARSRTKDGFHFNQGPHALYLAGHLARTLADLGIAVRGGKLAVEHAVASRRGDPTLYALPLHPAAISRSKLLDHADREQLLATLGVIAQGVDIQPGIALREFTAPLRPNVAASIETIVRLVTYVNAPERIEARAALRQVQLSFGGVVYLNGGWQTIVDGLTRAAIAANVSIRVTSRIGVLESHDAGWMVEDGKSPPVSASCVILAVAPEQAARLLPSSARLAAAAASCEPIECVGLDLALSQLPDSSTLFALGFDEALYCATHSAYAQLAPADGALVHLLRYLAPGERPSPKHVGELIDTIDRLQPGWRAFEIHRQRLFGARVANDFPSILRVGSRVSVWLKDTPGVFLAGDWVGDEGMLSGASAASAEAACAAVRLYLNHTPNGRGCDDR